MTSSDYRHAQKSVKMADNWRLQTFVRNALEIRVFIDFHIAEKDVQDFHIIFPDHYKNVR